MDLSEFQKRAHATATTDDLDVYILGLIGESGGVASAAKKYKRDDPSASQMRRDVSEELGDVLWYVAEIASRCEVELEAVALENLEKTAYLFRGSEADFDQDYPPEESFPELLEVRFTAEGAVNVISVGGAPLGDPLDDNAYEDDGYRFHDAFHLSYMTVLGWSPVLRKFLECKRKSNENVDRIEDGARARVLEEGISILVFSQSQPPPTGPSLFCERGNIPFWILENIKKMTIDLEVGQRSVGQWRTAISAGFRIFDQLRENHGGVVICDAKQKSMTFRKAV